MDSDKELAAENERLKARIAEIKAAVQEVEWKLTPEYLKEGDEEYIRCYIMPSGVWHLLLGTVRQ